MPQSKTVGDNASKIVKALFRHHDVAEVLRVSIDSAIAESTLASYRRDVRKVGGMTPLHFLRFIGREYKKPVRPDEELKPEGRGSRRVYRYATQTMRGFKSACSHLSMREGKPWLDSQSALVEQALAGYEAENRSPTQRGALTPEMFDTYLQYVRDLQLYDLEAGALVMRACGLRPNDVFNMCRARCVRDADGNVVKVYRRIKAPRSQQVRLQKFEHAVIGTEVAQEILQVRFETWEKCGLGLGEPFFPGFSTAAVREVLEHLSQLHGWPTDILLDGPHCFRHSMASDIMNQAIAEVKRIGGWKSDKSAKGYCTGTGGAGKARAFSRQRRR